MDRWVEILFDCLPLRTVSRLDAPLDASPKYRAFCERVKAAIETHGAHNAYYLYNARCRFQLTNRADVGLLEFSFEGALLTDESDLATQQCHLQVDLARESCDWLTEPVLAWFKETVSKAVAIEFNRYIEAGDLRKAKDRLAQIQAASDDAGGYIGMYL